ncbi:MAG TPA: glycosyltransferase [Azospirillum sp.]
MRLLFLMQGRAVADHPGYDDACLRLQAEGVLTAYRALPYYGLADSAGWDGVWREAVRAARDMEADAVFLQYFHGPVPDPAGFIGALRQLPSRPLVAVSSGDPFGRFTGRLPASFRTAARLADVTFLTEMGGLARDLARRGAPRVTLMPNGYCQARFDEPFDTADYRPEYDVVFIGNRIHVRNPTRYLFLSAWQRKRQVAALQRRYGRRFALFGAGWEGWPSARGPIPYAQQHAVYRKARVIVGAFPGGHMDYYMSDRSVTAIRSGIPFIDVRVPRVDRIFGEGRHWFLHRGMGDLLATCDRLLEWSDQERLDFGQRAAGEIAARHTQYHRMRAMAAILRDLREARLAGRAPPPPHLDYFLPEVNLREEMGYATAGWS